MTLFRDLCRTGRTRLVHGETADRTRNRNEEPATSEKQAAGPGTIEFVRNGNETRSRTVLETDQRDKNRQHRTGRRDLPRRPEVVSDHVPGPRAEVVVGRVAPRRGEPVLEHGTVAAGRAQPPAVAVLVVVVRETETASGAIANCSRQAPTLQLAASMRPDVSDAGTARRSALIPVRELVRATVGDDAGPGDAQTHGSLPKWSPDMGTSRSNDTSGRCNDCQHPAAPSR